jgi:AraC family transcriptional regulator
MKIAVDVLRPVKEPYLHVRQEHVLEMSLRPGWMKVGPQQGALSPVMFGTGEIGLFPRHLERWVGSAHYVRLRLGISPAALMAASDGMECEFELRPHCKIVDARLSALIAAVNAERTDSFPSGQLFLDSMEQALAATLVAGYAVRRRSLRTYRGGLGPARLRRVTELVHARMENELTLEEMSQSVGLSVAHFSQMFRKSTGESPHQFVLRHRVERAKEMLRAAEERVLDVAVACGFKTQQHFARVFRRFCEASPTEYRQEFLRRAAIYPSETFSHPLPSSTAPTSAHRLWRSPDVS